MESSRYLMRFFLIFVNLETFITPYALRWCPQRKLRAEIENVTLPLLPVPGETSDTGGHSFISSHPRKWPADDDLDEFSRLNRYMPERLPTVIRVRSQRDATNGWRSRGSPKRDGSTCFGERETLIPLLDVNSWNHYFTDHNSMCGNVHD